MTLRFRILVSESYYSSELYTNISPSNLVIYILLYCVTEMRPPSPEKELPESDSESEYETDSEEETEEAKV